MAFVAALAREKLLITARTLPAAPQVLSELGELLQESNTSLDQIAELLKRDSALAARIIRISNSTALGGGQRLGSVDEAVQRVGFGEVYRLVGLATTSRLADRALAYYHIEAEPLRNHMLFTALTAEILAEKLGLNARQAYTAGLMRTLGMLVLDRVARERLPIGEGYSNANYDGYAAWEGNVFSLSNCEVAAVILAEWKFPAEIVACVREHYLQREGDFADRMACLLNIAGAITRIEGFGLPGETKYWQVTARKLESLGIDEEAMRLVAVEAQNAFKHLQQLL
jgi:HD-like signal output (HDOD) protein